MPVDGYCRAGVGVRLGRSPRKMRRFCKLLPAILAVAASLLWLPEGRAAELLMFGQRACPFCDQFKAEIAPDYPKSRAGRLAPLRHVDIWESRTGGIEGLEPAVFTPTFVLVDGDREIGRLLGYPGRRYFYPEIQLLLEKLSPKETPPASSPTSLPADLAVD